MLADLALTNRRHMLRGAMAVAVAAGASGCARLIPQGLGLALTPSPLTDPPVFNFALNLEYLEAEYYQRGVNGVGLPDTLLGPKPREVTGGRQVAFQNRYLREFMAEIAATIAGSDALNYLTAPIKRLCGLDVPIPYAPQLERAAVPQIDDIVSAGRKLAQES